MGIIVHRYIELLIWVYLPISLRSHLSVNFHSFDFTTEHILSVSSSHACRRQFIPLHSFSQTNTCTVSLTETRDEAALLLLCWESDVSRGKRGFSTLLNIRSLWESQRHNTPVCRCLKFQMLKELAVQCIHVLYTNVGTVTSMIVDTKGHVLNHSVTFTTSMHYSPYNA